MDTICNFFFIKKKTTNKILGTKFLDVLQGSKATYKFLDVLQGSRVIYRHDTFLILLQQHCMTTFDSHFISFLYGSGWTILMTFLHHFLLASAERSQNNFCEAENLSFIDRF